MVSLAEQLTFGVHYDFIPNGHPYMTNSNPQYSVYYMHSSFSISNAARNLSMTRKNPFETMLNFCDLTVLHMLLFHASTFKWNLKKRNELAYATAQFAKQ